MQCKALRHNCRKCGIYYPRGKTVEKCEQCGGYMQCTHEAVAGYNYCKKHGGPRPEHGWYGQGRPPVNGSKSSRGLVKLASRHIELTTDARFLSNRHSMEIVWHRVEQLAQRIEDNEAPERIKKLSALWNKFRDLDAAGKRAEAVSVKGELDAEFEKAHHDYMAWEQLFTAVDLYRRMTESEVKIAKDLKAIMTAEDGMELVSQLLAIVIQVVNDSQQLKRIIYEFRKLVGDDVEERAYSRSGRSGGEVIEA